MIPYGIGRGFDRSRTNGWYIRVHGKKEYFSTELLRDAEYDHRVAEARLNGATASSSITPAQRQLLQEMQRLAEPTGYTPMEIFERGMTLIGQKPRLVITVADAVDQAIKDYERRVDEGLVGNKYFITLKSSLKRLGSRFANRGLHTLTNAEIQRFLRGCDIGPQTRINNLRCISVLFTWAKNAGAVQTNPIEITERVRRTPATLNAEAVKTLFEKADPRLVPMLMLQWFAGIRPTATHGMRWEDINQERRTISIRAEISKLKEPEVIEGLPDELWAWLKAHGKAKGRIAPSGHVKLSKALHKELGYSGRSGDKRWPTDVARHSFASHLYPRVHSIDQVAKTLCHRGSRVTLKHYVAKNVTSAEAEAYFGLIAAIRPAQP